MKTTESRMKPNPVYESMTRLKLGRWTARVWRTEKALAWEGNDDLRALIPELSMGCWEMGAMIERIASLPRVAAVEIVDENGTGLVFYPDWD